jgi:predicted GH43/DUF377 family glycosyl hydrolase
MKRHKGFLFAAAQSELCCAFIAHGNDSAVAGKPTEGNRSEMPTELYVVQVKTSPAMGLKDAKWNRQDPSNILKIGGKYHVWYARHSTSKKWNETTLQPNGMQIWMATSENGRHWKEHGPVLPPSKPGDWHECATHAPHVVPWNGKYYLFFSVFERPHITKKRPGRKFFGLAVSERPEGPYEHVGEEPIFSPSKDPKAFDHYLIDDPCIIRREGEFYLYYKGRNSNTSQCWLGAASAKDITGPYQRVQVEPVSDARWHTGCVWPHRDGVAGIADDETQRIAWSPNGRSFELGAKMPCVDDIDDAGVYCPDAFADSEYRQGITWGLALGWKPTTHIIRFDADLRAPPARPQKRLKLSNKPDAGDGK